MHVLCPSCETAYEIPPLRRPRKLRCARCASEWRVMPESALAGIAAEAGAAGTAFAMPEPAEPPGPERPGLAVPDLAAVDTSVERAAPVTLPGERRPGDAATRRTMPGRGDVVIGSLWLLSAVLLAAALWACWHWRLPIAHHWPPSLRLYRLLPGGHVPPVA